ncbi:MAG: hypothetical protein EA360_05435 [Balneolaceae bacterium]|nr:MAG: hypothetical protein EA360_05435 [Balneolaceae bacterium]
MKKLTLILITIALLICFKPADISAQTGDVAVGAGIVYGADVEEIGIQLGGTYSFNPNIRFGADLIYWLIGDEDFFGASFSTNAFEINGNFHYIFHDTRDLTLYGLASAGIHIVSVSVDIPGFGSESESDSEVAIGVGAGLEYNLGGVKLYAEPRVFLSGLDQFQLAAGVRIPF